MGGEKSHRRRNRVFGFRPPIWFILVWSFLPWFLLLSNPTSLWAGNLTWVEKAKSNPAVWEYAGTICQRLGLSRESYDYSGHRNRIPLQNACLNRQVKSILKRIEEDFTSLKSEYIQIRAVFPELLAEPTQNLLREMVRSLKAIQTRSRRIRDQMESISRIEIGMEKSDSFLPDNRSITQNVARLSVLISQSERQVISFLANPQTIELNEIGTIPALESISGVELLSSRLSVTLSDKKTLMDLAAAR